MDWFPDIRISREVMLEPKETFSFFLTVTNNSNAPMNVSLHGEFDEHDENCIDVRNIFWLIKLISINSSRFPIFP